MNFDSSNDKGSKPKAGSFQSMGLEKDILIGLNRMGYKAPTPVQRKALPIALAGMDLVCMARTGSGKTCVFLLPMIQKLKKHQSTGLRAIVLSPTRELAVQTFKFAIDMAKFTDLRIINIVGGDGIEAQFDSLANRPDIIIATPGRLMHHIREISTFKLKQVQYLVFDEADRLFEMGFAEQLNEIVRECPLERQTLLFSATMPKMLIQFSRAGLRDPQLVRLDTDSKMSEELRLAFLSVRSNEKMAAFLYLVRCIIPPDQLTIIFTATRHHSELLHAILQKIGVSSTVVYGTMDQDARSNNLKSFRNGEVSYMIVTDLAARGIDVPLLNNVINFHFPPSPKLFVHRCGRAARQGRIGYAISLVEPEELGFMMDVHTFLNKEMICFDEERNSSLTPYTLETMTPSLVHTGLIPQDLIDQENDFIKRSLSDDDMLMTYFRISENGMKQYRRTRTEASREGIKLAKSISKSNKIKYIHPLIAGCDPTRCSLEVVEKANYIRMLQTYRPAQTIFETGIGLGTGSSFAGKVNGGHLQSSKAKLTKGIDMMKQLRESTAGALERNRVKENNKDCKDVENLDNLSEDDWGDDKDEYLDKDMNSLPSRRESHFISTFSDTDSILHDDNSINVTNMIKKPRLSLTEIRKLKKKGKTAEEIRIIAEEKAVSTSLIKESTTTSNNNTFKDSKYYMAYGNENVKEVFSEDSMQPLSGLRSSENQGALMLENALLDVAPDEALELNKKKRMMRWDAKKRKFVKQSLEEMASNKKGGAKRVRSESGVIISSSNKPQGEMYEKWKKKSHREIGVVSFGDDDDDDRPRPNFKVNRHIKDEIKSPQELKKMMKSKQNIKLKNLNKAKRTQIEAKSRKAKKATSSNNNMKKNAMLGKNRKSKIIVRV